MSSVYRGVDTRLDRPVAIKIMDPRFADDRSFVDRFEWEARSAARLHHPHVVAVHDQGFDTSAGPDGGRAFLVLELVDGGTLRDLIDQRGALDLPVALTIAGHVLSALAAAHAEGLVHRDVKPENVLIGRGGNAAGGVVKVGDFGLVRAVASASTTSANIILGTVAYLSPEQVTTGSASERGDVYSAGILLYEMLTGQVPYTGDTALSVAYRHVNDDVPAPSEARRDLPPALDELALRATRRAPEARPANAGEFLAELDEVRTRLGIAPAAVPVPAVPAEDAAGSGSGPTVLAGAAGIGELTDAERTVPAMQAVTAVQHAPAGPRGTQALPRTAMGEPPAAAPGPTDPPTPPHGRPAGAARPPRRRLRIAALALVGLLVAGAIGTAAWWFSGGRWVTVPQVTGMDRTTAEQTISDVELVPEFVQERHNTAPSGTVIRTDPVSGSDALVGGVVRVVLSLGKPVVPDISPGVSVAQAEAAIRDVELEPVRDPGADEFSNEVAEGAVVTVTPQPGSEANVGDRVTIVVSKGPPPTPVPSLKGKSRDEAFQALSDAGFEPFDAGEEFAADVPAGSVTRTEPDAGATPEAGSRVGVYISNAVEVPSVIGRPLQDAVQLLSDAGLSAQGTENQRGRFSFVVGQDPGPGERVQRGSAVNLTIVP